MILTLTINPALDRNVAADRLAFEDRGYILSTSESPGGRGINASRVIHAFGAKTTAIAAWGGETGKRFKRLLDKSDLPVVFVPIDSEIRTNLTISDRQGLTVKLNEAGPHLSRKELDRIRKAVEGRLGNATWLLLCGSMPPGVDPHFYCELIEAARRRNVRTMLDTDGDALLHGLEGKPSVVTPNQQEAERLLNRALITRSHFLEAVDRIHGMGAESVVLSLGSRGAVAKDAAGVHEVIPPRIDAVCPIGAGDAMSAALIWALENKSRFVDAVRWGVAAGTASAKLPGLEFAGLNEVREMYKQVEARSIG